MFSYILLLVIISLITYFNIKKYGFDILSPSLLYNLSMSASIMCALIGLISWNNEVNLSFVAIIIILTSVVSFNAGEIVIKKLVKKKEEKTSQKLFDGRKKISTKEQPIELWKIIVEIVYSIVVFVLVFCEIYRVAKSAGFTGGGLGSMIQAYRSTSILFTTEYAAAGARINIIVAQLQKILEVMCYLNLYYLTNIVFEKKQKIICYIKKYWHNILIPLIAIATGLLTGSRMQTIIYFVFAAVVIIMKLGNKYDYVDLLKQHWRKIIILLLIAISFFYVLLPLTGRKNHANIVDYISFYFGASIPSLNRFTNEPMEKPEVFGEETFRGIQTVLYKLKISKYIQPISKEWELFYTNDNNRLASNIYTSGKRYYFDFGLLGVVILQMINGAVMTLLYYWAKSKKTIIPVMMFAMYAYMIIDQVRDEYLFSTFIHINTIFKFVVLYIGLKILNTQFTWRRKNEIKNG